MQTNFFFLALLGCYAGVTLWQIFICCGVFARFALYAGEKNRLQESQKNTLPPPFSVIICARNEADNLRTFLPAVLNQQFTGLWEVLVVDDASTDETPAILVSFQEVYAHLRVIRLDEKLFAGKKIALEQGITACKYPYILLTDADCQPAGPHWLEQMSLAMTNHPDTEIVLGYGPMKAGAGMVNAWSRFETAQTAMQYFSFALAGIPYMGVGRNLAFKKALFNRVGGFTSHALIASGDDDLLVNAASNRRNTVICTAEESFVFSESKTTWKDWLTQKRRHLSASSAYRTVHQLLLASLSLSHVLHYFFLFLLLVTGSFLKIALLLYALRMLILMLIYRSVFSRLNCSDLFSRAPFYDIILAVYYGIFVPVYLMAGGKTTAWK